MPKVVLSTDYTFSASAAQDKALAEGNDEPLGISAYYSGRAYGPAVVQNPDGSLTMVFSGYRLPKPIDKRGHGARHELGGALHDRRQGPGALPEHPHAASHLGNDARGRRRRPRSLLRRRHRTGRRAVTYTATVAPVAPGTGTPTGTVSFPTAPDRSLNAANSRSALAHADTATCTSIHGGPAAANSDRELLRRLQLRKIIGIDQRDRRRSADRSPRPTSATFTENAEGEFMVIAAGTPQPTIGESGALPKG